MSPLGLISFVVFLFSMIYANKYISNLQVKTVWKIMLCLLALLVITTIVDLVRGTPFASWKILFYGFDVIKIKW